MIVGEIPYASLTKLMNVITLTQAQAAFLDDRPGECVVDCMSSKFPQATDDELCNASEKIEAFFGYSYSRETGRSSYKPKPIDVDQLNELERATLLDYLEGSTVCGQLWDSLHMDRQANLAYGRAKRTLMVLVDKFRTAGLCVTFIPDA